MSPRDAVRQPNRPADYTAPLPPSVIGRGTDRMSADGIDATYTDAPDTRYGIGSAGVERPVVFEEPLTAYLDEQGEVPL